MTRLTLSISLQLVQYRVLAELEYQMQPSLSSEDLEKANQVWVLQVL